MRVNNSVVVQTLKRHAGWLRRFTAHRALNPENQRRVHDVVVWCLDFVELSPTTKLAAWLARRPHRKLLDKPERAGCTVRGRRAILELLELTISEVAASASFLPQIETGLLPGVLAITPERLTHLERARAAKTIQEAARRAARLRRLATI